MPQRWIAAILACLGLAVTLDAWVLLGLTADGRPGSGLVPLICGLVTMILAGGLAKPGADGAADPAAVLSLFAPALRAAGRLAVAVLVFAGLVRPAGLVAALVMAALVLRANLPDQGRRSAVILALAVALATALLAGPVLQRPLALWPGGLPW